MNKISTKKHKDSGSSGHSSSTEPLLMTQSFDMTPIPSGANSYTNNFRNGDHYNKKITSDSELTQPKAVEDGTNIGQTPSPHKQKMQMFSKKKLESMNPMPDTNVKETLFHSESIKESTHTEKCTDLPSNFPGVQGTGIEDNWGYLTPADPLPYPHVHNLPVSSTSDPLSNSTNTETTESKFGNTGTWKMRQRFQSSDSGLGDEQSEQCPGSLPSMYGPPKTPLPRTPQLPTHQEQLYEDIDHYQQAQESTEPRQSIDKHDMSNSSDGLDNRNPQSAVRLLDVTQDEDDREDYDSPVDRSIAETVSTPTSKYPQDTQSHAYTPFPMGQNSVYKAKNSINCQGRCCVVLTLFSIILVISLAALVVSIYVLVINGQTSQNLTHVLNAMKAEIESLKEENERLKISAVTECNNETLYLQLTPEPQNLTIALLTLERKLDRKLETQIANFSRTSGLQGPPGPRGPPGPEGPPGIANFSDCIGESVVSTAVGPGAAANTSYLPTSEDLKLYYPHFAYCDAVNATGRLNVKKDGPQYRCMCKAAIDLQDNSKIFCTVHVWRCRKA